MDISKVKDINMVEEHECPSNQRPVVEGMNMMSIHMVEVKGMDMVEDITTEMVEREHESVVTGEAM
jgi:hypothetical protein